MTMRQRVLAELRSLDRCHTLGLKHLDIKPANFVGGKLIDYGHSKLNSKS
jgi:serine/threonine protein kinase